MLSCTSASNNTSGILIPREAAVIHPCQLRKQQVTRAQPLQERRGQEWETRRRLPTRATRRDGIRRIPSAPVPLPRRPHVQAVKLGRYKRILDVVRIHRTSSSSSSRGRERISPLIAGAPPSGRCCIKRRPARGIPRRWCAMDAADELVNDARHLTSRLVILRHQADAQPQRRQLLDQNSPLLCVGL